MHVKNCLSRFEDDTLAGPEDNTESPVSAAGGSGESNNGNFSALQALSSLFSALHLFFYVFYITSLFIFLALHLYIPI